ncbi:MAG: AAA family ATPase [Alphaproteobacteria bacterium]
MLSEIFVSGTGSYEEPGSALKDCKVVNFIYGTNGAGKTTITRVVEDPSKYSASKVTWSTGQELLRYIYNSDFVSRNFKSQMQGVFTLGEKSDDTIAEITERKLYETQQIEEIRKRRITLGGEDGNGGKTAELHDLEIKFRDKFWASKIRYDENFEGAFSRFRGSKASFFNKLCEEFSSNKDELCDLDDLLSRSATIFGEALVEISSIPTIDGTLTHDAETSAILQKRVMGKEDVDLAFIISTLGNSDWVKQGQGYFSKSHPICPFCQQTTPVNLKHDLEKYFDAAFETDLNTIASTLDSYREASRTLKDDVADILALNSTHMNNVALTAASDKLAGQLDKNFLLLEKKKNEPSLKVSLVSTKGIIEEIQNLIAEANRSISKHNGLVKNYSSERKKLIGEIWKYIVHELDADLKDAIQARSAVEKAIEGLNNGIDTCNAAVIETRKRIVELERTVTSVQPTVNAINNILSSFGFSGFKLKTEGPNNSMYGIVRADGQDATKTLSEGEKNFVTFLYFYYLTGGSVTESGVTDNRIVMIDDPVSSLDSDVLFIVSSLIKGLIERARSAITPIKQVFVLTHNIYFHKEVAYHPKRRKTCLADEAFWIVRKKDGRSEISYYDHNPIRTSYEILWAEVLNPMRSRITIQNTLRRILETYFTLLGNMDKDIVINKFEGKEKQVCASLFSWINDGSHAVHDDMYIAPDDAMVEVYLSVFRDVFEKAGHIGHYNMMMGIES